MEDEKGQALYESIAIKTKWIPTDLLCSDSIRPPDFSHKFCSIKSNLNDIVEQSKEGSQRERGHEECNKPILDNCSVNRNKQQQPLSLLNTRYEIKHD